MITSINELRGRFWDSKDLPIYLIDSIVNSGDKDYYDESSDVDFRECYFCSQVQIFKRGVNISGPYGGFTISANNRYIFPGSIISPEDEKLIYFTDKPFQASANTFEHSISVNEYKIFFEYKEDYNIVLLLMNWSDAMTIQGKLPNRNYCCNDIIIDETVTIKYSLDTILNFDEPVMEVNSVRYYEFDYFNYPSHKCSGKGKLTFLSTALKQKGDGSMQRMLYPLSKWVTDSDNDSISMHLPIILNPEYGGYNRWLKQNNLDKSFEYVFSCASSSKCINLKGNLSQRTIYVFNTEECRGGHMFQLQTDADYYKLAAWIVIALSCVRYVKLNEDLYLNIKRFWPWYADKVLPIKFEGNFYTKPISNAIPSMITQNGVIINDPLYGTVLIPTRNIPIHKDDISLLKNRKICYRIVRKLDEKRYLASVDDAISAYCSLLCPNNKDELDSNKIYQGFTTFLVESGVFVDIGEVQGFLDNVFQLDGANLGLGEEVYVKVVANENHLILEQVDI